MNFELKKINWETGQAPSQIQLMTLRVRKESDDESSFITIADNLQVYIDGTILNPPQITGLENDTRYVFSISNNNPAGGSFSTGFITPKELSAVSLTKAYYPNSELRSSNGSGFRSSTLPPKTGAYYGLDNSLTDWFENYSNITLSGAPVWKKAQDQIGISLTSPADHVQAPAHLQLEHTVKTKYALGIHFYVVPENLPATGIWPLITFGTGDGVMLYVNCETMKIHWRQQNGSIVEEIISTNSINTGAWNKVVVFRAGNIAASQLWLNYFNTFTGALTTASIPSLENAVPPLYIGSPGGIFNKFYYPTYDLDNNIAGKYMDPPYPLGILEEYNNPQHKYYIYRKNMIVLNDAQIICTIPPEVPAGRWLYSIQTNSGILPQSEINILPLAKLQWPSDIDFSTNNAAGSDLVQHYYAMAKSWGGANGGVSPENIYMQDNLLVMEAHGDIYDGTAQGYAKNGTPKLHDIPADPLYNQPWTTRVGAVLTSKEYCGYGRYIVEAKLPPEIGVAPAFWTFHYGEVYPQDPRYEQLLAQGLHRQGSFGDGYYVVENNEIDIELPSHNANHIFATVAEMLTPNYHIVWEGETVAVAEDPDPVNNGTWRLNNAAAPNILSSWSKVNNDIQRLHQPRKDNIKCNNWKGELGGGNGFTFGTDPFQDEFLSMLTSIGKNVWDGAFHEFRFDWYANRVEFYVDGEMIQVNSHFVPDVPGRWTVGLWFPSQPDPEKPWKVRPAGAWAGPSANWRYQKMFIKRIAHLPFTDEEAGGANRLVGETYPFDGLKSFLQ